MKQSRDESPRTQPFDTPWHHAIVTPSQKPDAMCFTCVGLLFCPEVFGRNSIRPKLIKENSHVSIQITPTCANSNADRTHHTDSIRGDGCWSRYCQRTTDATAARSANSSSTAATAASGQPATAIHTTTAADSAESTAVTACRGKRWPQYRDDSDDSNCSTDNRYVSQHVRAADKSDSGSPGSALRACHRFTHPKSHASAIRCCRS